MPNKYKTAFTLMEVLVVVTILALFIITFFFFFQRHLMRARDAQRKSDLYRMRDAFEEYYNDQRCYPNGLHTCGGPPANQKLYYYLKEIPCDPLTGETYLYQSLNGDFCQGYRLLAKLEIETDKDVTAIGCDPVDGCGGEEGQDYNWGVAAGGSVSTAFWQTVELAEDEAWYCLPISGGGENYKCGVINDDDRQQYFEEGGCQEFNDLDVCEEACLSEELDANTACICDGSEYYGCK